MPYGSDARGRATRDARHDRDRGEHRRDRSDREHASRARDPVRLPASSVSTRETRSERSSAMPATGTPSGDVWIHSATCARQRASATPEPVRRTAHSSQRYSAEVAMRRRAMRLSGWIHNTRSTTLAKASQSGSRRARCASSCASMTRCSSRSSSVSALSGRQISATPSAMGLEMRGGDREARATAELRFTRRVAPARRAGVRRSTARRSPMRPTRISRRAA